jgi:hypothetical protein
MPIWFELVLLMLFTYALGLGIGWLLWGRDPAAPVDAAPEPKGDPAP